VSSPTTVQGASIRLTGDWCLLWSTRVAAGIRAVDEHLRALCSAQVLRLLASPDTGRRGRPSWMARAVIPYPRPGSVTEDPGALLAALPGRGSRVVRCSTRTHRSAGQAMQDLTDATADEVAAVRARVATERRAERLVEGDAPVHHEIGQEERGEHLPDRADRADRVRDRTRVLAAEGEKAAAIGGRHGERRLEPPQGRCGATRGAKRA
jgi:hypothetical protein